MKTWRIDYSVIRPKGGIDARQIEVQAASITEALQLGMKEVVRRTLREPHAGIRLWGVTMTDEDKI